MLSHYRNRESAFKTVSKALSLPVDGRAASHVSAIYWHGLVRGYLNLLFSLIFIQSTVYIEGTKSGFKFDAIDPDTDVSSA